MRVRSSWIAASVAALFGAAAAVSAGDVDRTIGTLPPGKTITIKFRVTTSGTAATVSNQATVNGTNFTSVLTDDPKAGGTADATVTAIQLSPTITIGASANPAAFGQAVTLTATVSGTGVTPTGTVQFKDGGVDIGSAQTLNGSGQATLTGTYAVGSHTITVAYVGDTNYNAGSGSLTGNPLVVGLSNTTTTVAGPGTATVTGQSATFTATVAAVAPGTGTPTGTVTFTEGGTTHCSAVALNGSGQATCVIAFTSATAHTITGTYSGSSNYNASNGNASAHTVNTAATSIAVSSSANPSSFGQNVTFTAAVTATSPGAGTPTGNVVFTIAGVAQAPIALVAGSASTSTATLAVGAHTVTVVYAGDSNFATSNGTLSSGQTVNKANTSVALASSLNPSTFGQPVTLTATVSAVAPGTGTPTGTATFKDGATTLGTVAFNGSGVATMSTASLAAGSHSLTVEYSGDSSYSATSGALTGTPLVVNKASTSTAVASSVNPTVFGQATTLTATVAVSSPGAGTPTGTVTFLDGTTTLGTGTLNGALQATLTTSAISPGARPVTAVYQGDSSFSTSTSAALTQTVNRATTSTALTTSVSPSVFGQSVTFSATVSVGAPGSGPATGTVAFKDGATTLATVTLNGSGQATFVTSTLAVGAHSIVAEYAGSAGFVGSVSTAVSQPVQTRPQFAVKGVKLTEGNLGTTPAVFNVTLSSTISQSVTAVYGTIDGEARAGNDYIATAGTLTFAPGETSKTVTVQVIGDTTEEPVESFGLELSNVMNATAPSGTSVGIIVDDDTVSVTPTRPQSLWQDFFSVDGHEYPGVGDFNGDGKSDAITFTRDNPLAAGDVYVVLSEGARFGAAQKWHDTFAGNPTERIVIGDFDGDTRDDVATWLANGSREVYVALSTGAGLVPESVWISSIGSNTTDVVQVGDANGDGKDDLILFARSEGRVYVALSTGSSFAAATQWHSFFAVSTFERPGVGDLNGDGRADIFTLGTDSPSAEGDVYVALSNGTTFVDGNGIPNSSSKWHDFFSVSPQQTVRVGDMDGDGKADLFTFLPLPLGQCYTALSLGTGLGPNQLWDETVIRLPTDIVWVGDVNGDKRADIVVFAQSERKVFVSFGF